MCIRDSILALIGFLRKRDSKPAFVCGAQDTSLLPSTSIIRSTHRCSDRGGISSSGVWEALLGCDVRRCQGHQRSDERVVTRRREKDDARRAAKGRAQRPDGDSYGRLFEAGREEELRRILASKVYKGLLVSDRSAMERITRIVDE